MRTSGPRIRFRPERLAAYLTLFSAVLGFVEQLRRYRDQAKVYQEKKRREKDGFGFGRPS